MELPFDNWIYFGVIWISYFIGMTLKVYFYLYVHPWTELYNRRKAIENVLKFIIGVVYLGFIIGAMVYSAINSHYAVIIIVTIGQFFIALGLLAGFRFVSVSKKNQ